jgi:hypothetical protein
LDRPEPEAELVHGVENGPQFGGRPDVELVLVGRIDGPIDVQPALDPDLRIAHRDGGGGGNLNRRHVESVIHFRLHRKALLEFGLPQDVVRGIAVVFALGAVAGDDGNFDVVHGLWALSADHFEVGVHLAAGFHVRFVGDEIDRGRTDAETRENGHVGRSVVVEKTGFGCVS